MIWPKDGKVVVFDSLRMEKATYNDFLKILEKYDPNHVVPNAFKYNPGQY